MTQCPACKVKLTSSDMPFSTHCPYCKAPLHVGTGEGGRQTIQSDMSTLYGMLEDFDRVLLDIEIIKEQVSSRGQSMIATCNNLARQGRSISGELSSIKSVLSTVEASLQKELDVIDEQMKQGNLEGYGHAFTHLKPMPEEDLRTGVIHLKRRN